MHTKRLLWIILILWQSANAQTFESFITRLNTLPIYERQAVADSFMNVGHDIPYRENDTLVHYIYNGDLQTLHIAGDLTGWDPNRPLSRITGTTFWYRTELHEKDARLDYKYVINGTNWILDPLNPHTCTGGFGPNSELRMPGYSVPPEIAYYPTIAHGTVKDTVISSVNLGNSRSVKVYLPYGYATSGRDYPMVLFHDGLDYVNLCNTVNILDYLIANRQICPVIAIFVPAVNRTPEYAGSQIDLFTEFIVSELLPLFEQKYRIRSDPSQRATIGASNGGNIALYIGMKHPEEFGKIGSQSSNIISPITTRFASGPKLPLEIYLDIGSYDIPVLIPMVNNFHALLLAQGYPHQYFLWHEGHSWGNWRGHLPIALRQFFPITLGMNEGLTAQTLWISSPAPNPFHDSTLIRFGSAPGTPVKLTMTDISGKHKETLFYGVPPAEGANVMVKAGNRAAGTYILTLGSSREKTSIKIQIIR